MPVDTDNRSTLVLPPFGRRGLLKTGAGITLAALPALAATRPAAATTRAGWRYCTHCRGLVYANLKRQVGVCPAGGKHRGFIESLDYFLHYNTPPDFNSQLDNFKCLKCASLFTAGTETPSRCPAGGRHQQAGVEYLVWTGPTQPNQDAGWRWCDRCWSLFWPYDLTAAGACPRGGKHRAFLNSEIWVDFT